MWDEFPAEIPHPAQAIRKCSLESQELAVKAVGAMTPATGGDHIMNVKITLKDLQRTMFC